MDWMNATCLVAAISLVALLWYAGRSSLHPMSRRRRRALFAARSATAALCLLALARPAVERYSSEHAVMLLTDHSHSLGPDGMRALRDAARLVLGALPDDTWVGVVSAGDTPVVRCMPTRDRGEVERAVEPSEELLQTGGSDTDLAAAVDLAAGLFPPGATRRIVVISDGVETRGSLERAARTAATRGVIIDAIPVAGTKRADVRVTRVRTNRSRSHEGASLAISADIDATVAGAGRVRLFENGVEVDHLDVEMAAGETRTVSFRRTPERRNLYNFRVAVDGFEGDEIPQNNEGLALVDVGGRPVLLYIEGEPDEARYLAGTMASEGIALDCRPPEAIPEKLEDLAGYDAIIVSDVPAHRISMRAMSVIKDYVEILGGGFVMIGGKNSFGVGGYYRTPIEEILPVKMKAPDYEERYATALALVIDRSGSMDGDKIEICKSAAIATIELLTRKDYVAVVAFDSVAQWVVPLTRVTSPAAIASQIATISAGGGTNIHPGMVAAQGALAGCKAKVKHMIVLSDGQTYGSGYQGLAAQLRSEGVTVSTVAVGSGADTNLLTSIAAAGGGSFYETHDPSNIPRIFTQDAMVHLGRLIHEESFLPKQSERHPMLQGYDPGATPELLGYVKTTRRASAQVPLVTQRDDPLLAHWRFGLGKVTAFTSDCKSRWAALWLTGWDGYGRFWAQVLRETAREPQGTTMDIRLTDAGDNVHIAVDVREDGTTFANGAQIETIVHFVPAHSLGSSMREVAKVPLRQDGPGLYLGTFRPEAEGVYLVRARAGADMVSAGIVHDPSKEAATGQAYTALLASACSVTGGSLLDGESIALSPPRAPGVRVVELAPLLIAAMLAAFLVDIALRRWENVLAVAWYAKAAVKMLGRALTRT
jgi:Ca-activated chloride channel family protein